MQTMERLSDRADLKASIKNNIIGTPKATEIVYAILFAFMCVSSRITVYSDDVTVSLSTVFADSFKVSDIAVFIGGAILGLIFLRMVVVVSDIISLTAFKGPGDNTEQKASGPMPAWLFFVITFVIIALCYIPYIMSYWPGGIYNDTSYTIDIALGRSPWSDQNTVLYALFWKAVFFVGSISGQGDYGGLKLMTILQSMSVALVESGFITRIRQKGAKTPVTIILTVVAALVPVIPFYGISLWKETWFGLAFFLYTLMWTSFMSGEKKIKLPIYIMLTTWIIFGRNNGLYVIIVTMIISVIILKKSIQETEWRKLIAVDITIVLLSLLIRGPVFGACGVDKSAPSENFGIPIQQIAYMINCGVGAEGASGHMGISEDSYNVVTSIMPLGSWISLYDPVVVDTIKFSDSFNRGYFDTHTTDFIRAYLEMSFRNPVLAFKGYILSTMGFWDMFKSSSSAYICTQHTVQSEYLMSDYFAYNTGKELADIVGPRWYISGGLIVWIMLALFVRALNAKSEDRIRLVLPLVPGIALWITYMIATPLSFSFRYLFGLLLCLPLYFGVHEN